MFKSIKYQLKPSLDQKILLNKHFGCVRFVYNHFLNEHKIKYLNKEQVITYFDTCKVLTQLKHSEGYNWLKEVNSQSLQITLKYLDSAFIGFFKKRTDFPRFKSKNDKNSFPVPQDVKIINNRLYIRKFKSGIPIILHKKFEGQIRQCTVSKSPNGKYYVAILFETIHKPIVKTGKVCGIDLGIKDFVITSDGKKYINYRYTKKYTKLLKRNQQRLSKKIKDSNRYKLQKIKVAKIYAKITNSRIDNLHKVSHELVKKYDVIFVETLDIKQLVKNRTLSKAIADVSWGTFISMLEYKCEWNEKTLIKVDRFFPSSKTCNNCNYINQDLKLKTRTWKCPSCKKVLDRDLNASKNILKEGLKIISLGTNDYRHGGEIRPSLLGTTDEMSKILN